MAAILFFKMNEKVFKSKPLKPILSEIRDTFAKKKTMRVTATAAKRHNQSEQNDQIWAMTTLNTNEDILKIDKST